MDRHSLLENDRKSQDKIVYFGVVNISENGKIIGAVDIWRSVLTKDLFCEEKRLGILEIAEYIGMPKLGAGEQWAVAINKKKSGKDRWKLIKIIENGEFSFLDSDNETRINARVIDFHIVGDEWWSFLIFQNVNKTVEIVSEIIQK
jgi:hypothetical protein